jgi:putative acetyltransferase
MCERAQVRLGTMMPARREDSVKVRTSARARIALRRRDLYQERWNHELHAPADMISIREARDADGAALSRLIASVFAEYEGVLFRPEEFPELAAVASHFEARGGRLLVAEAGGRIVGSFGYVMTHEEGVAEILKVYLAREFRGRGIAGRLLARALDEAEAAGARGLVLWSDLRFTEGHRFYERHGFVRGAGLRALHDASETLEIPYRLDRLPARGAA